jgi:transcription antitermination protein NusB
MGLRREGREAAVQFLFAHDLQAGKLSSEEREAFWEVHSAKRGARNFAENLINGVLARLAEVDHRIATVTENFSIERLGNVDRNILRLAIYELMAVPDVPPPVVINEAIEIAKKFASAESASFVNGVLDRISRDLKASAGVPNAEKSE